MNARVILLGLIFALVLSSFVSAINYYNPTNIDWSTNANAVTKPNGLVFHLANNSVGTELVQVNLSSDTTCIEYGLWNFSGNGQPLGNPIITCNRSGVML